MDGKVVRSNDKIFLLIARILTTYATLYYQWILYHQMLLQKATGAYQTGDKRPHDQKWDMAMDLPHKDFETIKQYQQKDIGLKPTRSQKTNGHFTAGEKTRMKQLETFGKTRNEEKEQFGTK